MLPSVRFTSVVATIVILGGCGGSSLSTSTGPSAVKCVTSLSGLPATVPAEGTTVRANVSAERECAWNARPEAGWVQVAPATGQGASQVTVVVAANDAAVARSAAIDLNGTRVTFSQAAAACRFELRPRSAQVAQNGGTVQVSITALQGCSWTVSNQTPWVSPSRTRGSGSGTIELTIAGNSGTARSASLTIAGQAYCWGTNVEGELGDGGATSRSTPVAVSGQLTFAQISAGGFHACGLTTGGQAYCWGWNAFGQLGIGSAGSSSNTPRAVAGGLTFASLSAGNRHTCGVTPAGVGYCWGDNANNILGTGLTTTTWAPELVAGGLSWAAISAGRFHTCGVTTAGAAYCWGAAGAIGDGTNQGRGVPTRVF